MFIALYTGKMQRNIPIFCPHWTILLDCSTCSTQGNGRKFIQNVYPHLTIFPDSRTEVEATITSGALLGCSKV